MAASAKSRSALMPSGYLTVDWITYPVGDVDKVSLYFSPVHIITGNLEEPEDLRLDLHKKNFMCGIRNNLLVVSYGGLA